MGTPNKEPTKPRRKTKPRKPNPVKIRGEITVLEIDVPDSYYNKTKLRSADKAKLRKALAIPGVKVSLSSRYLQVTVPKRDKIADARWANAQEEYKRKLYAYDHEEENYKARMLQYERDLEAWNNHETAKRIIKLRAELKELGGI